MFENKNEVRIPLTENGHATHLECKFYYSKGGLNVFTYREEPRGWYVSVGPITVEHHKEGFSTVSFTAFSGIKECVMTVGRKSAKNEREARELAEGAVQKLIETVCEKNDLTVAA